MDFYEVTYYGREGESKYTTVFAKDHHSAMAKAKKRHDDIVRAERIVGLKNTIIIFAILVVAIAAVAVYSRFN